MNQEKVLHHVPSEALLYSVLKHCIKKEITAPGMCSSEGLPILAIRKQESKWVDKNIFSYTEKYPAIKNKEGRKPEFEVIVIRDSLPKNVQEFVMYYEAHMLMKKPEDSSFFGPHIDALTYAIQKCTSGFRTYLQYLRLQEACEEQVT